MNNPLKIAIALKVQLCSHLCSGITCLQLLPLPILGGPGEYCCHSHSFQASFKTIVFGGMISVSKGALLYKREAWKNMPWQLCDGFHMLYLLLAMTVQHRIFLLRIVIGGHLALSGSPCSLLCFSPGTWNRQTFPGRNPDCRWEPGTQHAYFSADHV